MPSEPEGSLSPGSETCHLAELCLPHTGHRGGLPEPPQGLEGLEAAANVEREGKDHFKVISGGTAGSVRLAGGGTPCPLGPGKGASRRVLASAVQMDAAGGGGGSTRVGSCLDRSTARGPVPANTMPAAMLSGFPKARDTV